MSAARKARVLVPRRRLHPVPAILTPNLTDAAVPYHPGYMLATVSIYGTLHHLELFRVIPGPGGVQEITCCKDHAEAAAHFGGEHGPWATVTIPHRDGGREHPGQWVCFLSPFCE